MPLLSIQNLGIAFRSETGTHTAVSHIELQVNRGEMLAIVGESGSGKSVTAMSVLQLLPKANTIYIDGNILFTPKENEPENLLRISPKKLQDIRGNRIAMIFQEPMSSLNPVITCGKQVMEAIMHHQKITPKQAKHHTIHLFEKVQLPNPAIIFNRYPHQLSGGQKQRIMIAMAISCKPDLLICDEPTTALDATVQQTIVAMLKQLQTQQNIGIIFITHDLALVGQIADRVVVLYKGKIVEHCTVKEIFLTAKHPYTKALLACRPALYPKEKRLPVVSDFMNENQQSVGIKVLETNHIPQQAVNKKEAKTALPADFNLAAIPASHPVLPILSVKNLCVWYATKKDWMGKTTAYFKAVNHIDFDVNKGETLGLVGESGCGKTTLGRAILQLITATSGSIFFNQKNIMGLSKNEGFELRKQMQIIFQDPYGSLNPRLTIGRAIAEPLKVHGILKTNKARKDKVMEWLEKVNLKAEHYNRYPHEFSGGQRQRIVIARALVTNPSFVVADECVSALDVSVQAQVLNLLNDLKKELGFTTIFISHDMGVVKYLADRILVMNQGQIEEIGTTDAICNYPTTAYTKKLLAAIPKGFVA